MNLGMMLGAAVQPFVPGQERNLTSSPGFGSKPQQ